MLNKKKVKKIKLFVMDVDGVLTDGGIYYDKQGNEFKKFNMVDGKGILLLKKANIKTAIITGENNIIAKKRSEKLKIDFCVTGSKNKLEDLKKIIKKENLSLEEVAYVGDGINDYNIMKKVAIPIAVKNATKEIKKISKIKLKRKGGEGAIDEAATRLLKKRDEYEQMIKKVLI